MNTSLSTYDGGPSYYMETVPDNEQMRFFIYNVPRFSYFSIVFNDPDSKYQDAVIFDALLDGEVIDTNYGVNRDKPTKDGSAYRNS